MLKVRIFRQEEALLSFSFEKSSIQIGRSPSCDISLPDPTLSRIHAMISYRDGDWIMKDLSQNGIFTDSETRRRLGERTKIEKVLKIRMGRIFSFSVEPLSAFEEKAEKTLLTSSTPTQLISVDSSGKKMILGTPSISVTFPDGKSISRVLNSDAFRIGSHLHNDLSYSSNSISQFHAKIEFLGGDYWINDLASTNGTYVNDLRTQRAKLPAQAEIRIGPLKILYSVAKEEMSLEPRNSDSFLGMVSRDTKMRKIFSMIEAVAHSEAPVLIRGETGTGKELVARSLHTLSRRYAGPFLALNSAAFPTELIESELFGHERGSFSGATQARKGAFEMADKGTLFLDEIGELDLSLQAKLLRTLETGEVFRVGSSEARQVSVRVISATHKDLIQEVEAKRFREDLFYRLHVLPIELPPLRDRIEDLDLLIPHFLKQLKLDYVLHEDTLRSLKTYSFPGNIRELKNALQRACLECQMLHDSLSKDRCLRPKHFGFLKNIRLLKSFVKPQDKKQKEDILKALQTADFKQTIAAKLLKIPVSTLHDRVRKFGIQIPKNRKNKLAKG